MKIKNKDRLIAKMVATAMWSVATFNLVTGYVAGVKADMLQREIDSLEEQKITCVDTQQLQQIDDEINQRNQKIEKHTNFLMPSVYSFLASGAIGSGAIAYEELKKKKQTPNVPRSVDACIFNRNSKHIETKSETQICKDMLKDITHNDDTPQNCGYPPIIKTNPNNKKYHSTRPFPIKKDNDAENEDTLRK